MYCWTWKTLFKPNPFKSDSHDHTSYESIKHCNYLKEAQLLHVAHQYQLATDFHLRQPEGI